MKRTTVVRLYSLAFMVTTTFTAHWSFAPHYVPTERPAEAQRDLYENVPTAKPGAPPKATGVGKGEALAYMRIPRFGKEWLWTVSEGTDMEILNNGPGHFASTALPGARGNSAYAAHRSGHGDPFLDFEDLRPGDEIILAQGGGKWTYKVTIRPRIIEPTEAHVVRNMQYGRLLTLTTCWPKYGSEKRMYIRARLDKTED